MIDLRLLGTGAMMPLENRWLSSLLVRCQGDSVLFDCGEGTQIPIRSSGWGFRQISTICLSHLHADHVAGLPGILHSLANSDRREKIAIYGPVRTCEVVTGLRSIVPELPFEIVIMELHSGDRFNLSNGMRGSVIAGEHRVPSLIYRLDLPREPRFDRAAAEASGIPRTQWSRLVRGETIVDGNRNIKPSAVIGPPRRGLSVGFMTDTRPVAGAAEFLYGVDLLVIEGTYGDSGMSEKALAHKHMTFSEAASIACTANVGRLWLTHFSPAMLQPEAFLTEATNIFPSSILGFDGLTASLRFPNED